MQRQSSNPYFRMVDYVFYHEEQIRQEILERRHSTCKPILRNGSKMSDPTAAKAIFNVSPIESVIIEGKKIRLPELWLLVIDKTYEWSRKQKNNAFEVAFRRYSGQDYRRICEAVHISQAAMYQIMESVRMYAALQAVQFGLIHVE